MLASLPKRLAQFVRGLFQISGTGQIQRSQAPRTHELTRKIADAAPVVAEIEWQSIIQLAEALSAPPCARPFCAEPTSASHKAERAMLRPLASQLSVTGQLNVKKGRKPARGHQKSQKNSKRRTATVIKPTPTAKHIQKKRAPKRRHVWLSTQARIVRTITSNVTTFQRAAHSVGRLSTNKHHVRAMRDAA